MNQRFNVGKKQIMAHPLNEAFKDQSYELCSCEYCKVEYLSQCLVEKETERCPLHMDIESCVDCGEMKSSNEMKQVNEHSWKCEDCQRECIECGEKLDKETDDSRFCSQECYNDYWADMDEDEHKNY